jgi:hypothetical protein
VDSCPKAEPQEQRSQKQKARSNPYVIIYNFIGYFTLVLHDFPLPVLRDPLHVEIPQVFSLCNTILTSLLLYQNPGLSVSFLALFPAVAFPVLMLRPALPQRASSGSRGLYFHNIITCVAIFLCIMVSVIVLVDLNTGEPGRAVLSMPQGF